MSNKIKLWLIIAVSLIIIGGIIFVFVMCALNWNFNKLSTFKYETNTHNISTDFTNITIECDTADVQIVPSEDAETTVVCYEQSNIFHFVSVSENTLFIKVKDTRKWYEYIGINFSSPKITVHIPSGEYGDLSVKVNTGNIEIPNEFSFNKIDIANGTGDIINRASALYNIKLKATTGDIFTEKITAKNLDVSTSTGKISVSDVTCHGDLNISVSTGKSELTNIQCENLTSSGNTGKITMSNVLAASKFSIIRTTGDVIFNGCDATQININTGTGNVNGTLLSEKVFITNTGTGKINVPKTTTGGVCDVETSTGNIDISIN